MKPEVSSMFISYPTPSSSSSGPASSNSSHACASSKPALSGSPRQSVPASRGKDDLVPKEEIKDEIKQEDEMSAFAALATPKEEDVVSLKQEDGVMGTALPSAASTSASDSASPSFVPRIKTQEAMLIDSMSLDSPTRTASPQPMLPAPEKKLDTTGAPDEERRASPARTQVEANGELVTAASLPAADAPNQSLEGFDHLPLNLQHPPRLLILLIAHHMGLSLSPREAYR
ncbi:hypothetical protein CYLTODRAFT_84260 [Cylindrobasidium torrendii FP15055 ss-10]|uniref:Uncharacterized protein n=1 Tax=Cylindrobasidium torrendii FP15055 ss-10 TaxID=1314674 RepID=A0A0D7B3M5_9AGAR|nr:hypothetical protein CYLTODRAFT_84260 [Cylindrobasidium torrendii FP15055 ss-10]